MSYFFTTELARQRQAELLAGAALHRASGRRAAAGLRGPRLVRLAGRELLAGRVRSWIAGLVPQAAGPAACPTC